MPVAKSYILTYYKFPENFEKWMDKLSTLKNFKYCIGQVEECPTTKRKHIQSYIEFCKPTPMKIIHSVWAGCHCERRKGTRDDCIKYCSKYETRVSDTLEIGDRHWNVGRQGRRTDIQRCKDMIKAGKNINEVIWSCTSYQSAKMATLLLNTRAVPRNVDEPPNVVWIYGATGTGKTRYVYENYRDIYTTLSSFKWWDGYHQNETILIDDMRKDYCKFHVLLRILDRYPMKVEFKGGVTELNSKNIVITSAYHPKELYNTREDVNQLLRRITKIIEMKSEKSESGRQLSDASDEE